MAGREGVEVVRVAAAHHRDERQGAAVLDAVRALPRGSGVVLRHLATPRAERAQLSSRVRAIARARRLVVAEAGESYLPAGARQSPGLRLVSVHDARELAAARRMKADLVFVSPVFPTRTHPGAPALGRVRFAALAMRSPAPVIALGGMTARRARGLPAYGWAAIDGLTPGVAQKRKAVPR